MASFLEPLVAVSGGHFAFRNERTGAILANVVEAAFDSQSRRKGLLGRDRLEDGHGLVIAPTNSVHTFFMRFPIDLVYVSRDGGVVKVTPHVRPWRASMALRAYAVIELPTGTVGRTDTRAGDRIVVERLN